MSDLLEHRHPDADQLNAFVEQTLPAHERVQTLAHLAECPACRQVVALSLPPKSQPEAVRVPWFSGWRLAWVAVPALAGIVLLGIFFRSGPVQKPAITPMATEHATVEPPPPPATSPLPLAQRSMAPLARRKKHATTIRPDDNATVGVMGGVAGITHPTTEASTAAVSVAAQAVEYPVALPSHLAALSIASQGGRRLAIDTRNQLFLSQDDGQHWTAVPLQWQGRAIRVAVAGTSNSSLKVNGFLRAFGGTASLSGAVTDSTGAVIPGANVSATDAKGIVLSAVTDPQGKFRFEHLAPGDYRIEAEMQGFAKQSVTAHVAAAQQAAVDLKLQAGSASESVTVAAAPSELDKMTAPAGPGFELTTEDGVEWTSPDGLSWSRK